MGVYAAHCMAGVQEQTGVGMAFELFTHATRFMGHKARDGRARLGPSVPDAHCTATCMGLEGG